MPGEEGVIAVVDAANDIPVAGEVLKRRQIAAAKAKRPV
jgi:hypothetical protein